MKERIYTAVAFVVPVLLYLQTLTFGFTRFDDDRIILNNKSFLSDMNNVGRAFQTDAFITGTSDFYRPLQTVTYMFDRALAGHNSAPMHHLSNIFLLGLTALLLYKWLLQFAVTSSLALYGTLLFCAHPLFVSAVAWIPARGDLLLAVFTLMSFLFLMAYSRRQSVVLFLLHWITFTAALFSKETAALLPVLFLTWYGIFAAKRFPVAKIVILMAMWLVTGMIWFWIRAEAVGDFTGFRDIVEVITRIGTEGVPAFWINLQTFPESLTGFFIPADIDPVPSFSVIKRVTGLVILVVLLAIVVIQWQRGKKAGVFFLLWFILLMLPALLFKHELIDYLNHRFLLPLMGILLLVLWLVPARWQQQGCRTKALIMVAIWIVPATLTFIHSQDYKDATTFYQAAIAANPKAVIAYNNRGAYYHEQGLLKQAIGDYSRAIDLNPDPYIYYSRGNAYFTAKEFTKATLDYSQAIEMGLVDANAYNNRGVAFIRLGAVDKACADFERAVLLGSVAARGNADRFCRKK